MLKKHAGDNIYFFENLYFGPNCLYKHVSFVYDIVRFFFLLLLGHFKSVYLNPSLRLSSSQIQKAVEEVVGRRAALQKCVRGALPMP